MRKYNGLNIIYNFGWICYVRFKEIGKWNYFCVESICIDVFCVDEVGEGFYFI